MEKGYRVKITKQAWDHLYAIAQRIEEVSASR